jgi:hypothetical protein
MYKRYFDYYRKGFNLLNQNIIIFLISILLTSGPDLNIAFFNILNSFHINLLPVYIIAIPLNLLSIGYLFVPLLAFNEVIEGKKVTINSLFQDIKKMFFRNLKLILAGITVLIIWFGLINPPTHPRFSQEISHVFGLLLNIIVLPLFPYFGIFYAIKKESFGSSVIDSIQFARKNVSFSYFFIWCFLLIWYLNSFHMLSSYRNNVAFYIYEIVITYVGLIIQAAFLLYYKEKNSIKQSIDKLKSK